MAANPPVIDHGEKMRELSEQTYNIIEGDIMPIITNCKMQKGNPGG